MKIVIIGFTGVGKTTVGKLLAKKIGFDFIDTDCEIKKINNLKVSDIFKQFGEKYFRDLESNIVETVSAYDNIVISTGGGIVLNGDNLSKLKENGFIICLKASPQIIYRNILEQEERPVLGWCPTINKIKSLMNQRKNLYDQNDLEINVDNLTSMQVIDLIINTLKEKNIYDS